MALPVDDLLIGDLTAPHWRVTSGGKIQIESKEEIAKRLHRPTDAGDAVVQAFAPGARRAAAFVPPARQRIWICSRTASSGHPAGMTHERRCARENATRSATLSPFSGRAGVD